MEQASGHAPIVYVPKERTDRALLDVLVEKPKGYFIMWFHWPYNDYQEREDFEPVVLFILGERLVAIGIRPGNRYAFKITFPLEEGRPVVVFDTAWHHPQLHNPYSLRMRVARSQLFHLRKDDYRLIEGTPPSYYYAADSGIDIVEWADERSAQLSMSSSLVV